MTGTRQLFAIHLQRDDVRILCETPPNLMIYPWSGSDFHFKLDNPELAAIIAWMAENNPEFCKPTTIMLEAGMIIVEDEPLSFKKLKAVYEPVQRQVVRPRFDSHDWISKEDVATRLTKGIEILFRQLRLSYPHLKNTEIGL